MPRPRRNADRSLRDLERLAAQGDKEAQAAVVRERMRTGQLDLSWVASVGPSALQHVPKKLLEQVYEAILVTWEIPLGPTEDDPRPSGWFPNWERADKCPRGHEISGENPFTFRHYGSSYEEIYGYVATADTLFVVGNWEGGHGDWRLLLRGVQRPLARPGSAAGLIPSASRSANLPRLFPIRQTDSMAAANVSGYAARDCAVRVDFPDETTRDPAALGRLLHLPQEEFDRPRARASGLRRPR